MEERISKTIERSSRATPTDCERNARNASPQRSKRVRRMPIPDRTPRMRIAR